MFLGYILSYLFFNCNYLKKKGEEEEEKLTREEFVFQFLFSSINLIEFRVFLSHVSSLNLTMSV